MGIPEILPKLPKSAKSVKFLKSAKFRKKCQISSKKCPETLLIKGWLTPEFKKKSLFFTFEPKNPVTFGAKFRGRPSFWVKFLGVATFWTPKFWLFLKILRNSTTFDISQKRVFWTNFTLFALFDKFRTFRPPHFCHFWGFCEKLCVQIEIGVRLLWNFDWTRSRTTSVGWLHSQGYWNVLLLFRSFGSEGRPAQVAKVEIAEPGSVREAVSGSDDGGPSHADACLSRQSLRLTTCSRNRPHLTHRTSTTLDAQLLTWCSPHLTFPEGVPPRRAAPHLTRRSSRVCQHRTSTNDRNAHPLLTWAVSYVGGRATRSTIISHTHTRVTRMPHILHHSKLNYIINTPPGWNKIHTTLRFTTRLHPLHPHRLRK